MKSHRVEILPEAEREILGAYDFYEGCAAGLGERFRARVTACLDLIVRHLEGFAVVEVAVRRIMVQGFPYAIFYFIEGQKIVVFACFHCSRDPAIWRSRR